MRMRTFTRGQKIYFALLANLMVPLAGMSTDIYLPSLPAISQHFSALKSFVQLTVTSYIIAMGFAQLIAGPISDAYGRKKLLLFSLLLQLLSVIGILLSASIYAMIVWRFMQGLGAALMIVPARAILNDIFTGQQLRKQFNYTTISFALGPIVAPFIGGYLQDYFGWQANFYFLFCYLVMLILMLFLYVETISLTRVFSVHHLWKNYHIILRDKYFLVIAIFLGILYGYIGFFNIIGPFLIQDVFDKSVLYYGRVALLIGFAWFLGNTFNRILFDVNKKIKTQIALGMIFIMSIAMMILVNMGYADAMIFIVPTFMIEVLSGLIFPIYVGEGIMFFPSMAASVNACLFSLVWLIYGISTFVATLLDVHSLVPIAISYTFITIMAMVVYYGFILKLEKKELSHNTSNQC